MDLQDRVKEHLWTRWAAGQIHVDRDDVVEGVVLLQQVDKLVSETARRREAAAYLNERLGRIPGITPVRVPDNSRGVYHLFPVRYSAAGFNGLGFSFLNYLTELPYFAQEVLPRLKQRGLRDSSPS